MVHQFDDRMYVRCLQHESVQQQQHQQQHALQRQLLTAAHQYTVGPATPTSTTNDYVMYPGSGNATGRGDIAATSPTTACRRHHAASYVTDAVQTNQHHHHHLSQQQQQQQQHIYYTDYLRHQLGSECVGLGPAEDGRTGPVTVCWTYPSTIGDTDACEGSSTGWPASVGVQYSGCMQVDDPLDLLTHQLQNPDKPSQSDNVYVFHTPSSDIRATAAVTTTTGPTSKIHLQPEPDVAGPVSAVKQHLIDIESRAHHVQVTESSWAQSEPAFGWMKKQSFSALTPTGNKTRTKDKYRIVYTEQQKVELEKEFLFNQYITIQRKAELAGSIGLTDRQVKIWFQNRRAKERKCRRKQDEVGQRSNTGMGVASLAPAAVGGAKTVVDAAARLHDQPQRFQYQHQHLDQHLSNDVIKMESVSRSHDNVTSSMPLPQHVGIYSIN